MSNWLHNLPIIWMAIVVFGVCYFVAAVVFFAVDALGRSRSGAAFRGLSPGMLSPLGVIFGLLVAFIAAQVWNDVEHARLAVDREASSLRTAVQLAGVFPHDVDTHLRQLVRRHIDDAVSQEWPRMADQSATVHVTAPALAEALQFALTVDPKTPGQTTAQKELASTLESALQSRRERIILSRSNVNWVKWTCVFAQALFVMIAIAFVHIDNRGASAVAIALFTTGFAVSVLLIASHDCPFTGDISIKPDVLLQVKPDENSALLGNRPSLGSFLEKEERLIYRVDLPVA
jgi:hypothetical protein